MGQTTSKITLQHIYRKYRQRAKYLLTLNLWIKKVQNDRSSLVSKFWESLFFRIDCQLITVWC